MTQAHLVRPDRDHYYMGIAVAVRRRANCLGSRVGSVMVLEDRVVSTGYNGTPAGMPNCDEGGCIRCGQRERFKSGEGYDLCICVHAEQNALLMAAKFGIRVEGATAYVTMRPCFGCSKELLQAGVKRVVYLHEWIPPREDSREQYMRLQNAFELGAMKLEMDDPEIDWAVRNPAAKGGGS